MNLISTSWSCARCGAAFISTPSDSGLCRNCAVVTLREIFYGPAQIALTASQSDCLHNMLADATAHRSADTTGCPHCQGTPAETCAEHAPEWTRIEAYRQLVTDLGEKVPRHGR